jgi:hypothetical protein
MKVLQMQIAIKGKPLYVERMGDGNLSVAGVAEEPTSGERLAAEAAFMETERMLADGGRNEVERRAATVAAEFGYRAAEKGMNLQMMLSELRRTMG